MTTAEMVALMRSRTTPHAADGRIADRLEALERVAVAAHAMADVDTHENAVGLVRTLAALRNTGWTPKGRG